MFWYVAVGIVFALYYAYLVKSRTKRVTVGDLLKIFNEAICWPLSVFKLIIPDDLLHQKLF